MTVTTDDRLAIYELIALHGHLMDAGDFDRLDELFTEDFVYDLEHLGYGQLRGAKAFVEAATALGDDNPQPAHRAMLAFRAFDHDRAVLGTSARAAGNPT